MRAAAGVTESERRVTAERVESLPPPDSGGPPWGPWYSASSLGWSRCK
jgi:hypothetical protein